MRFLLAAIRKNQRRIRIEQWLLLAVRTLIILLVVSAMAKPFLESLGAVIAGRRVHRVLVLDASLSMGYTAAGTSRFDQAKALAAELVQGLAAGRRRQRDPHGPAAAGGHRRRPRPISRRSRRRSATWRSPTRAPT